MSRGKTQARLIFILISHFDLVPGVFFVSSSDIWIEFQEFSALPYSQRWKAVQVILPFTF